MRNTRPLLALILTVALPLSANAAGQTQGPKGKAPLTVGDFAVMLAATTGRGPSLEVKSATEALVKAGVPLGNPRATLSEQKLVEILGFYGVSVRTFSPSDSVGRAKAETALTLLNDKLLAGGSSAANSVPTPSSLDDCLVNTNHGQCENCCKALNGSANTCSKFCFQIRTSDGEPIP